MAAEIIHHVRNLLVAHHAAERGHAAQPVQDHALPYIFWNFGLQIAQQWHQITMLYDKNSMRSATCG